MKNKKMILKNQLSLLLIFISLNTFAQNFGSIPMGGASKAINGIEYNYQHYDGSPRGLKKFLNETEMPRQLKSELAVIVKSIKNKDLFSGVVFWSGFAIGGGIMINESINKSDNGKVDTSKIITGIGVAGIGTIIAWIIEPKKKDYYNFINTFNKNQTVKLIEIGLKIDYSNQMNYGLAITF